MEIIDSREKGTKPVPKLLGKTSVSGQVWHSSRIREPHTESLNYPHSCLNIFSQWPRWVILSYVRYVRGGREILCKWEQGSWKRVLQERGNDRFTIVLRLKMFHRDRGLSSWRDRTRRPNSRIRCGGSSRRSTGCREKEWGDGSRGQQLTSTPTPTRIWNISRCIPGDSTDKVSKKKLKK